MTINTKKIREDFSILDKKIVYMDSSCVSLKPRQVVDEINSYYNDYTACGARSSHSFAMQVTNNFENTRKKISKFFNSKSNEIVYTRNTSEAINLVTNSFNFKKGDKVLISDKEHNSNLIPWQVLAKRKGINLEIFKFGDLIDFEKKVKNASFVSTVHTSNLDGTTQDIKHIVSLAKENGAHTLIDGAQSAPHKEINLKKIGCDFFAASGHKMLGPSGTGFLFGKYELLEKMNPFLVGGETVIDSTYDSYEEEKPPHKFEAGLQNYAGIIGYGAAIDYLSKVGVSKIQKHEQKLNRILTQNTSSIPDLSVLGDGDRGGIFSFNIKGLHPHDIALQLDSTQKIMIRSGHHCCHSWFNANKIDGSARASLYLYNNEEEIEKFTDALKSAIKILK